MLGKRRARWQFVLIATAVIVAVTLMVVVAQGGMYDVSGWTIAGGSSSGGGFILDGTAGQPAAGQNLTGGGFTLTGGGWSWRDVSYDVYLPVVLRGSP
jgi:hypothetical protein